MASHREAPADTLYLRIARPLSSTLIVGIGATPWIMLFYIESLWERVKNTPTPGHGSGLFGTALILLVGLGMLYRMWRVVTRQQGEPGMAVLTVISFAVFLEGLIAAWYWMASHESNEAFGYALTRSDTVYFTISTATGTGMADIHPMSAPARLMASGQMILSIVLIVVAITIAVHHYVEGRISAFRVERTSEDGATSTE
jgi:Ion channel